MRKVTTKHSRKAVANDAVPAPFEPFGSDALGDAMRSKIREVVLEFVNSELAAVVGATRYERAEQRRGYRHGSERRTVGTSMGPATLELPRARLFKPDGSTEEWRSQVARRYQRRARDVDNAIVGAYLGGVNTRKLRGAPGALVRDTPLSKSAVSRIVTRLKAQFDQWKTRPLRDESCVYLYLDGFNVKVRCAGRVSRMTVLAIVGVRGDGNKVLLALELAGSESEGAWKPVLDSLVARGLAAPLLCVVDGCQGLDSAIGAVWNGVPIQRCAVHKLRNLLGKAPAHAHDAVRDDFHAIVYADSEKEARAAYQLFLQRWSGRCQGVV
jgi:transposase-like protein